MSLRSEKTNEPKKNKSSYIFFCTEERIRIKNDDMKLNNKEILTELGLRWKKLKEVDPEKVKYYEKLASDDKLRYKSLFISTVKENTEEDSIEHNDIKKVVINGYINFCKENRNKIKEKNKELSPKDITKKLAEEWKLLTKDEKEKY